MTRPRLRLLHETNPEKYFPALYELARRGRVDLVGAHRYSVGKEWVRAGLRDRTPLGQRSRNAWGDFLFRLRAPFVRGEVIVIGFAPWDWRLLIYRHLARHNRILYQTSWHDWRFDKTPRQPKPPLFRRYMQRQWLRFLHQPNVAAIAVTPKVAQSVTAETGVQPVVIPHSLPDFFFNVSKELHHRKDDRLRLIYVGELSEKKGLRQLLHIANMLKGQGVTLSVVGTGPLAAQVQQAGDNVTFLGPIRDRTTLAQLMTEQDVLMLLSQRTEAWEELFGIVIIEALASGLAVLATDHVGPRQILEPCGGAGLFAEDDLDGVLAQLQRFVDHPHTVADLVQKQAQVAQAYRIETVMAAWMDMIDPVSAESDQEASE
ncbi:glycosyltransferase family 4 protein [Aliiroseovarius crassostreae]|uniref:glycosyltransferase family 4 protein n=1 Tax=Aliiroseovarius crassostreae TaxID=154981 RepID=UPI003C7C1BD0